MRTTENISQLATALALAQGQIQTASKDIDNAFYKSKYADIHSVWEACREPLTKNGLSVVQVPSIVEGRVRITTRLMHKSGEWIEENLDLKPKEDTPQAIGSCITYGKRYMLLGIAGVTAGEEDDDGNKASFTTSKVQQKISNEYSKNDAETKLRGFSHENKEQVARLEELLTEAKISKDSWLTFFNLFEGKDFEASIVGFRKKYLEPKQQTHEQS